MLIFVQVYKIIDKILCLLKSLDTGRTNESNGINKKETLCIWRKVLQKSSAPEVMTCHQKQVHHKHLIRSKITRSWSSSEDERLKASKVVQMI